MKYAVSSSAGNWIHCNLLSLSSPSRIDLV
jgi:hypothetical protein